MKREYKTPKITPVILEERLLNDVSTGDMPWDDAKASIPCFDDEEDFEDEYFPFYRTKIEIN